jgi:mannosyltransferase
MGPSCVIRRRGPYGEMNLHKTPLGLRTSFIWHSWVVAGLLIALASVLRFYGLDGQLWFDEISALRGYRKPFLETLTTFPIFFPNPLYELLAHASLVSFGESAASIRLPAAVFGVGCVLIFYRLAQRCLGPGEAVLAATLLAVSYHHVYYSQDARGYTTYLFFALLATDRLLVLLETMRWRTALTYAAASALATYAHPFGLFVLAGHMLVALPTAWSRRNAGDRVAPTPTQVIATAALGTVATLILYAPLIRDSVAYAFTEARSVGHGPRVLALLPELIEGMRASFGSSPVLLLGVVVGALGASDLFRRCPVALSLLVTPLTISAITIAVLGAGVHPRYFLLALPLAYMVGTRGLTQGLRWLLERVPWLSAKNLFRAQIACAVLITIVACVPLLRYYALPKQDFVGAIREVHDLAGPEDQVVAADLAGRAITGYYDPDFRVVDDLEGLLRVEAMGRRVWVVTTLERPMAERAPELLARLHRQYERVRVLAGSVGDGSLRIYMREMRGTADEEAGPGRR